MSFRPLEIDGHFTEAPPAHVVFDGKRYTARPGEPLAMTLLAHAVYVLGRSGKYHRGRGVFCGRGSCGNCLARLDGDANVRLCLAPAHDGQVVSSQNVVGSARFDLLQTIDWLFPNGLDHHHLMVESHLLNQAAVRIARHLAGLGELPAARIGDGSVAVLQHAVDVAVVGGGPAGRAVGAAVRAAGLSALVLEVQASDEPDVHDATAVLGLYDDTELIAARADSLLRIRLRALVLATGAYELPPACPGNDLPGVLSLRAGESAMRLGIVPGRRVVVAVESGSDGATHERAQGLVNALLAAGAEVQATIGPHHLAGGRLHAEALEAIEGSSRVRRVRTSGSAEQVGCDAVVWCGRTAPACELARQLGISTSFDTGRGAFVPRAQADGRTSRAGLFIAGEAAGVDAALAAEHGAQVGAAVAATLATARLAAAVERGSP
jgi:sarcosine oxidase, subunit alpha